MTEFSFIHAADLHLGSPLSGLAVKDEAVARRFAEAGRAAFSDLVSRAIATPVDFLVIAGDIYDGDWRDNTIGLFFNREMARLERAGIPVYLLRGNHDAASVITRSVRLPDSVFQFATDRPQTFRIEGLQVALHGQGFADRAVTDNLVIKYPPRVPGWFNIGVLHTALTGRPAHDSYAPCSTGHLRAHDYDYWALGHVHDYELLGTQPHIVFPGNLQGRHIREQGEKGAVLVGVADGRVAGFERLIVDHARWAELEIDIAGLRTESELLHALETRLQPVAAASGDRLMALRLRLVGEGELHGELSGRREQLIDEMQAAAQRVHGDIWLERVDVRTRRPVVQAGGSAAAVDLDALLGEVVDDPVLRRDAAELVEEIRLRFSGAASATGQTLAGDIEVLIGEARDLLLARAGAGT